MASNNLFGAARASTLGGSGGGGGVKRRSAHVAAAATASASAAATINAINTAKVMRWSDREKETPLHCTICLEYFTAAHITACGHSYCYECILHLITVNPRCPKCSMEIGSNAERALRPNFALDELVKQQRDLSQPPGPGPAGHLSDTGLDLRSSLLKNSSRLDMSDVDFLLRELRERRDYLQNDSFLAEQLLLKEFLQSLRDRKNQQLYQLQKEVSVIESDLKSVQGAIDKVQADTKPPLFQHLLDDQQVQDVAEKSKRKSASGKTTSNGQSTSAAAAVVPTLPDHILNDPLVSVAQSTLPNRRHRMNHHFDDLSLCYRSARIADITFAPSAADADNMDISPPTSASASSAASAPSPSTSAAPPVPAKNGRAPYCAGLQGFSECLYKFTRYDAVKPLATLTYTADMYNNASIVSSIEFDKDSEFFAIAGVTKRIKVYDYNLVLRDSVDLHYPSNEMGCNSKISCIAWNAFYKSKLVSSDYEGTVVVWDAHTRQRIRTYQEHEKRCWSVDCNRVNVNLIASGSDDSRVKLWSTTVGHSVASLEAKANVCCVRFNPDSPFHLAFGSADHCVHYYDLRQTKAPLCVFRGHKKAVSYVKFLNGTDLVSASTDSHLKLWNVNEPPNCVRSYQGHVNEKNFIGLATDGDYITCGSENNSLYVYYKGLTKPLFSFKFDVVRTVLDREQRKDDDSNEFVSAVCWRKDTNVIIAANSQGTIKVLQLV